ncbi:MAG: HelD family protein [Alphaproteobacteria bacterium]
MTIAEREELSRLQACHQSIEINLQAISSRLNAYAREIQETKEHMWEARRDLDHIDKVALRQVIEQKTRSAEVLREQQQKLLKLRKSPYFGRFDFAREGNGKAGAKPIYVGVHDCRDEASGKTLVHDWRAPISSMFYDYEIGLARYQAPSGEIHGRLELKRQFRIRDGRMEFMLESGVNIVDDVLQQELSRASDDGMKNIVATIQRDQNAIIRDAEAHTLIIQGVAGSGKTSIALHRIAFLLYRFKDTLSSKDILIISPNRVFADYIGNVLPELGEEQVSEIGMETLADELLEGKVRFQTFFEQTALLLERNDEALRARIAAKSSLEFMKQIDAYIDHLEAGSFKAAEWRVGRAIVPAWHFEETWQKYRGLPVKERIAEVIGMTEHQFFLHYKRELRPEERRNLREAVRAMVRRTTLRAAYKGLFDWMGRPELFKPAGGKLEYADVFPLIYLQMRLEGVDNPRKDVKHLLIDEMQDYTSVQYAVLGKLFPCRKTILGDATQSVNPTSATNAAQIQEVLRASAPVKLTKSYRSTWEIMQFALGISPNDELVAMERHGEPPQVVVCKRQDDVVARIVAEIEVFEASPHRTLAVIAKTQKQASDLHRRLTEAGVGARLLDSGSTGFSTGVLVCTAHLAKGLEFDRVIVPDASAQNYRTEMDRNLLYVACTRAMHRLTVIALSEPSNLLPPSLEV